jgi:hypothetical protein
MSGSQQSKGYYQINTDNGVRDGVHRYVYEQFFCISLQRGQEIDHIDGNPNNNSIDNLQMVDSSLNNLLKKKARKDSSTGIKGVSKSNNGKGYVAKITYRGNRKHLGTFPTASEAEEAYKKAFDEFTKEYED